MAALERIEAARVTLNEKKCKFHQTAVNFLGHVRQNLWKFLSLHNIRSK